MEVGENLKTRSSLAVVQGCGMGSLDFVFGWNTSPKSHMSEV